MTLGTVATRSAFLVGIPAAGAQTTLPPPAPPVSSAPAPATGSTVSPILVNPAAPARPMPAYPATPSLGPIDQQKQQSYRSDLSNRLRQLDDAGVSPGSEQYREYQQQLNQPAGR
jgi:hypothetical protein